MAEEGGYIELFNFDRVLWDKKSRRRICQVSFKGWTLAWCGQQSLILVNTKDVEASAHVSLEPIREEVRAVSCQSSSEIMFLAILTEMSSLYSVTVGCDDSGKPAVQSVARLDSQTQQEGDLLDVAYHTEKQLILTWSKRTLHVWSESADGHWSRGDLDIHLSTREDIRTCCWMQLEQGSLTLLLAAGEMIQHVRLDSATLEISTTSSMQLPGPVRRLVTDGNKGRIVAGCEAPLLKSLTSPPESEFLIAEAAPSHMPQSVNVVSANGSARTANVPHCTACVVVMTTDEWGSPRILTTVPVPDVITPDLVAITSSSRIIVSSSMSSCVSIFHGEKNIKLLSRVNLEACGIGRLLEVFPDNLSTGTDTCYAVVKHDDGRSCGSADATSQAFLSLQPKQLSTVKLVRIDFSSLRPEYKGAKGTNKEAGSGTSDARSGVFASVKREEGELHPAGDRSEDLTLGMSEVQLSRLVIPPPAVRCTWNPVPELMETARAGLVGGGPKEKASHIDLGSLWEDGSSRAVDWTEMVTAREKMRERMEGERKGWVKEAVRGGGTTVWDERRIHRREEKVASAGGHGGGSLSAEKAVSQSGRYPSVGSADILDVTLCQPVPSPQGTRTLSFLLCLGMLHLPTVKKAFRLPADTLLVVQIGGKDVILVQDEKGFLPITFSKDEVLEVSTMVTQ